MELPLENVRAEFKRLAGIEFNRVPNTPRNLIAASHEVGVKLEKTGDISDLVNRILIDFPVDLPENNLHQLIAAVWSLVGSEEMTAEEYFSILTDNIQRKKLFIKKTKIAEIELGASATGLILKVAGLP